MYIQEIPTLPPSVVPVPTAIPVFIGYTQKAIVDGSQWNYSTKGATDPVRVESLLDFTTIFGGAYIGGQYTDLYTVELGQSGFTITNNNLGYNLYTNLQMFYANGGGTCYIISVGSYNDAIAFTDISNAIDKAEKVDEITLVVIPEATDINITDPQFKNLNDEMLAHCAKMQDRFALLDVKHKLTNTIALDASDFRNGAVGINNLSYGAAYYPPLNTTIVRPFQDYNVKIVDSRVPQVYIDPYTNLFSLKNGFAAYATIIPGAATSGQTFTINGVQFKAGVDFAASPSLYSAVTLRDAINNNPLLNSSVVAITAGHSSGYLAVIARNSDFLGSNYTIASSNDSTLLYSPTSSGNFNGYTSLTGQDVGLYNSILAELNSNLLTLHPGATMAGIYTSIDNSRGVWKAPANVSVNGIDVPSVPMTDDDQSILNVDSNAGKSIDAIRTFKGRGTLVWGARTLDGNSNDFRYVNVRRTLIFIEHSCKLASEFVVFEPNDKGTWIRVKGMISNFLNNVWRDGGLVGDKPDQAYFVKVGLGETMTAQDILEGRLIVTIGLAISHPAEFIILQFEHKLQEA
ncbi:MAG TPA: phage tail sheath C-terminal domain-containing protein [Bacteroidia bacterium]|nr:phage tail sheath C-terminal domain-containing protein [Bacteroidia bacterium]